MTKEAEEKSLAELKKLKSMSPMSAESTVVRNYLDWMVSLPWGKTSKVNTDINDAKKILDEDHFGLEKVKDRILEADALKKNMGQGDACAVSASESSMLSGGAPPMPVEVYMWPMNDLIANLIDTANLKKREEKRITNDMGGEGKR